MLIFDKDGYLPDGDYELTPSQLRNSILVSNPSRAEWDEIWRERLLENFFLLASELWQVGITEIYIDGSFVEEKDRPNDIDGYFVVDDFKRFVRKDLHRALNAINRDKIWTWSQLDMVKDDSIGKRVLPMWQKYRVELFPDYPGSFSGIRDRRGRDLGFPEAFRSCRRGRARKGIIKLVKEASYDQD